MDFPLFYFILFYFFASSCVFVAFVTPTDVGTPGRSLMRGTKWRVDPWQPLPAWNHQNW